MKRRSLIVASAAAAWGGGAAAQGCPALTGVRGLGEISLVGNSFRAITHIARQAERCAQPGLKVSFKLTPNARTETEQAFASAGRSPFDGAVVSKGVFSTLYARGQLAPLTALVEKHRQRWQLEERMLVRVDGEVVAIAFMQNTQCLYYRADLLERHGLKVPATYAEMVNTATVLKAREPSLSFPIAQAYAKGSDVANDFINVLAGCGGRMFEPGSAEPAFHRAAGLQAVAAMRSLMPHMTPNALASNSEDVGNQFQQGKAALGVLWASSAARMDDPTSSQVVGKFQFAAAPAVVAGGPSASHLWWDAVVMPANAVRRSSGPDAAARQEAAFHVLMQGLSAESVRAGNDLAIWVRSNWRPGRGGNAVALAQAAGAREWPGEPFLSLAHVEIGKVLPEALTGERSVQSALDAAASSYRKSALEKGFAKA
ncbi:MAG TPA: extracellular solute-binding protein [Rubrivivax sp.]|nr:extracellular solute-binding protein [Rubrivivax sp.]